MKLSLLFGAGCLMFVACGQPNKYGDDTSGDDVGTADGSINITRGANTHA